MSDDPTLAPAPIPVGVRPITGGSRLVLDAFAQTVIEDVLDALLSADRDSDLYERLVALAELTSDERALLPEHRMPYEELVADLGKRASTHTHLYGWRGLTLAEQLATNALQSTPAGFWPGEAWQAWQSVKAAAVNGGAAA